MEARAPAAAASSGQKDVWDSVASSYDASVLDNLQGDLFGVLTARLTEVCDGVRAARREEGQQQGTAEGEVVAVDFGCGAGKWLGALASRCDLVVGIDISAELLQLASAACSTAVLLQRDLGERWPLVVGAGGAGAAMRVEGGVWPRADVAVCANVIMSPDPLTRRIQLENLSASLRPGGALLLVVPAADSIQVVRKRQHDWIKACAERGLAMEELDPSELGEVSESNGGRGGGVYPRLGVLQKHWRRDEIISAIASVGLQVTTLEIQATRHRLRSQKSFWKKLAACVSRWRRSSLWSTPGGQSSLARRMKRSGSILGLWRRARAWGCVRVHLTNRCHPFWSLSVPSSDLLEWLSVVLKMARDRTRSICWRWSQCQGPKRTRFHSSRKRELEKGRDRVMVNDG